RFQRRPRVGCSGRLGPGLSQPAGGPAEECPMHNPASAPDNTAVRVALWRALHMEVDSPPHVLEDDIGLRLVAPDEDWRRRPDMDPVFTKPFRASILARARFIEDLVLEQAKRGIGQYVILGAGLDTFVQRRPEMASRLRVFEIDRPGPQSWKRQRLIEVGLGIPDALRLVPVDFETSDAWGKGLTASGFDAHRAAVVASAGVSIYLSRDAVAATLRDAAVHPGDDVRAADRARRSGAAARPRARAERRPRERHAVRQLFHTNRDPDARAPGRLQRGPAHFGGESARAVLRGQSGWPLSAERR